MKRVISLILVLAMLTGVMPVRAAAEEQPETQQTVSLEETTGQTVSQEETTEQTVPQQETTEETAAPDERTWEDFRYTLLADGSACICGFDGTPEKKDEPFLLEVPESIQGAAVTEISEGAFAGNDTINALLLPKTLKTVGSGALEGCENLKVIAFCGEEPSFGESLAKNCDNLVEIDVLENRDFSALKELLEEDLGREIFHQSFKDGQALVDSLTGWHDGESSKPDTVENSVRTMVYSGTCGDNLSWTIDDQNHLVVSGEGQIPASVPWDVYRVETATLENGITNVGAAFTNNPVLKSVTLPDSLTIIDDDGFSFCYSLEEIVIPEGVSAIGAGAFLRCGLVSLTVPKSVTSIGDYAFGTCPTIREVHYGGTEEQWGKISIGSNNSDLTSAIIHFSSQSSTVKPVAEDIFNNHRYAVYDLSMTWTEAKEYCENLGGHLVTITSAEEQAFIESLLPEPYTKKQYWLGATSESGEWVWVTNEAFEYANWGYNQPDHQGYADGRWEEYAEIFNYSAGYQNRYTWNDIFVDNVAYGNPVVGADVIGFICEYDSGGRRYGDVRYFSAWDEANRIAYFGSADLPGQVTEETDVSFTENPTAFLGQYVLVKTKPRADGQSGLDTLISMTEVESKTGTVSSADKTAIVIGKESYETPSDMNQPESYAGQFVLYHLRNGSLVGMEILETAEGTLTYWNEAANVLNVAVDGMDDPVIYTLSSLADEETVLRLNSGSFINSAICFITDCNNLVFHLDISGFIPQRDGWSFRNNYDGFGYEGFDKQTPFRISDDRYEEVFGASYVASARASSSTVFESMIPEWSGNCYGMSLTAILFYVGQLNLEVFCRPEFLTANSFFTSLGNTGGKDSKVYAVSGPNSKITKLIESYQILQCGTNDGYKTIDSTFDSIEGEYEILCTSSDAEEFHNYESYYIHNPGGNYIQMLLNRITSSEVPLVLEMQGAGGHALVSRTDKKPQKMNDGTYRVYVYDPNHPYLSEELINQSGMRPASYYSNGEDLYVELSPVRNQWRYHGSTNGSTPEEYWGSDADWNVLFFGTKDHKYYEPHCIYASSIYNVGLPLYFNGTESWLPKYQNETGFVFAPDGFVDITLDDGTRLCSIENGIPVAAAEGVNFTQYIGGDESGNSATYGKLTIPYSEYVVEYRDCDDISILGMENVINIASSGNATLHVSVNDGEIQVTGNEDTDVVIQLTNVYSNSEYTSVVADGSLKTGDSVTLQLKDDQFDAELEGDGSLELSTDNEESPDSTPVLTLDDNSGKVSIDDVREIKELSDTPFQLDQDYLALSIGDSVKLSVKADSEVLVDFIRWSAEDATGVGTPQAVVRVDADGTITAQRTGTAYVTASVTIDGVTYSDRCRVDVTAQTSSAAVQGVQLGTTALTTELFRTDYAKFDVILLLEQNQASVSDFSARETLEDQGVAVDAARFEEEAAARLFDLVVKDDRTLVVVPGEEAVSNPGNVANSYTSKVTVTVGGETFTTDSALTLTVKKTMPVLKAEGLSFNSFYTNQKQSIVITGATVTGISRNEAKDTAKTTALPDWLTLAEGVLTLTEDAPAKSASGSVYVLAETEEWAVPMAVTVPVKLAYKAPALKLSSSSVTFAAANSRGVSLKLLCGSKTDTLTTLRVSGIQAPEGFEVRDFSRQDGSFTLVPSGTVLPGTENLVVSFAGTEKTVALKLKISAKPVTLSVKPGTVTLNSLVGDSAVFDVTASPADCRMATPSLRLTDSKGTAVNELDLFYSDGTVTIKTNAATKPGAAYKLYISAGDSKEAAVTIKTLAEKNSKPTLSAKVEGTIDLTFPESCAVVRPSFRNYCSGLCTLESWSVTAMKGKTDLGDVTDSFEFGYWDGQYRLLAKGDLTAGNTYLLTMTFSLDDGSTYRCSVKVPVKRTAVKLKLSATNLSLNKSVEDMAYLGVQCLTKNYDLKAPLISAPENLFVSYRDGQLFVAVNEKTEYGATYQVSVRATQYDAPVTLTVKIPAENKSTVTATLKAAGQLDVIRDSTAITVTPTYKIVLRVPNTYWRMDIYSSADNYVTPVTDLFHVEKTDSGSFVITRAEGAQINPKLKYRAVLTRKFAEVTVVSAPVALKLTAGSAKITAQVSDSALYAADKNSRVDFRLAPAGSGLNEILSVRIKNESDRNLFELFDYGSGNYAVGFRDGEVDKSLLFGKTSISLPLEVTLDGNGTPGAATGVTLKIRYVPYSKTTGISLYAGVNDVTGKTLEMDTEGACLLTVKSQPANAPRQYVWSSSDEAVATVDPKTNVVYPHSPGKAVLTCTAADGSRVKAEVTILVTQAQIADLSIRQTYCLGETLNSQTLDLRAVFSGGYEKQILEGFTCTPSVLSEAGTQSVTVSYGGLEKTFEVEVLDFYELSAQVENISGEGYNEDGRVSWVLYVTGRYTGNYTAFSSRNDLPISSAMPTDFAESWLDALNGQGGRWVYCCSDRGYGEYHGGCGFTLPDDPELAGRYQVSLSFGDVSKTATFTLVYEGDYTTGTGWSVSDVSWS